MMNDPLPKIQRLDIHTANRIAAGEVVERPASIAKELIENSIDAGATAITIEIRGGGIDYLRVTDNGTGIAPEELPLAFERHATSKIRSGDLLDSIGTLGFRGEALPSVASVSRVEITSRLRGGDTGARLEIEGGELLSNREAGSPEGTTFVVRELFFNTPARRKFLKRPGTEGGYVGEAVLQQALARPDISFRFLNDGKTVFHTPGDNQFMRTMEVLLGREIARQLIPLEGRFGDCELAGAVGLQDAARANRQQEYFFVNGRFVKANLLASALEEAVRGRITIGRYPTAVLYVTLPPDAIDVNVHPNKLDIRFRDENLMRSGLMEAISNSLSRGTEPAVPLFSPGENKEISPAPSRVEGMRDVRAQLGGQPLSHSALPRQERSKGALRASESGARLSMPNMAYMHPAAPVVHAEMPPLPPLPTAADAPPPTSAQIPAPAQKTAPKPPEQMNMETIASVQEQDGQRQTLPKEPLRVIGSAFSTYVLAQRGGELLIVDQHAAHERLLYDRFLEQLRKHDVRSQKLLLPYQFSASPAECARLAGQIDVLLGMGFEIESFGENSFRIDAVPHVLGSPHLREFIIELLASLDNLYSLKAIEMKRDEIARMACRKAVKAGDALTSAELEELLSNILDEKTPLTCPHGRPVLVRVTQMELERRFRRIQ